MNVESVRVALAGLDATRPESREGSGRGGARPSLPVRNQTRLDVDVVQVRCLKIHLDIVDVPLVQGRIAINVPRRGGAEHRRRTARRRRAAGSDRTNTLNNRGG